MAEGKQDRVKLTVNEQVNRANEQVRWRVLDRGSVVVDLRQTLVDGAADTKELNRQIATHFGVAEDAVEYAQGSKRTAVRERFVPYTVFVNLAAKPKQDEPQRCDHLPVEQACEQADCNGTPPVTTPMDRDRTPIPDEPSTGYESGDVTGGREIIRAVARSTGLPVTDAEVANNGWSDIRWGVRKVHGVLFTVDGIDVRVLSYDGRPSRLVSHRTCFAAVYVADTCVAAAINQERPEQMWRVSVVQAIVDAVEPRHDERALAKPTGSGWWLLKNPPVGFNVDAPGHDIVEVVEPSTNGGATLRVADASGTFRFIDRAISERWPAAYGGAVIDGKDSWARYERRAEFSRQVLTFRHQAYGHDGPASECDGCCGEVAGGFRGGEHRFGRYVKLPCCALCGLPRRPWEAAGQDVWGCPGTPRYPDGDATSVEGAAFTVPSQVLEEPTPASRVHVRSSSPVTVDAGQGRQGLANPTWCGRINDEKAWHVHGLKAAMVTCPVCFHLFTCPWARLEEDRGGHCEVCAHIDFFEVEHCRTADHPGIVPAPDPNVDRSARTDAVVQRFHEALHDGDLDLADQLIDAGEDYEPRHDIAGHDGWEGLRVLVGRARRQANERAVALAGAATIAGDTEVDGNSVTRLDPRPLPTAARGHSGDHPDDESGALWGAALDDLGL